MIEGKAKNITEAAEQVGIARETLSRNMSRTDVAEQVRNRVVKALAMAAPRAAAVKAHLMESDNSIVRERASSFVLGMIGIAPQQTNAAVNVNIELRAGYVIDIAERDEPRLPQGPIVDVTAAKPR